MHHEMQAHFMHHVPPHSLQPAPKLCKFLRLNRITYVIDWSPLLVIPSGRFPIPCRAWITLVRATRPPPGMNGFAEPCMQSVVSLAFITAVSLALMSA
jgi:hypothetical protein